jgi:hypothetical protein
MLTRENKIGLVLAFLLGISDIAFLATLSGDGEKPPVAIVVLSVLVGIVTLVLVVGAWRNPTWSVIWFQRPTETAPRATQAGASR